MNTMKVQGQPQEGIFTTFTGMLEKNILHPIQFATSLYHDTGEVIENLIDWKRGDVTSLPNQKLLSVICRLGAVAILGLTVYQITFATGTALLVSEICNRIFFSAIAMTFGSLLQNNKINGNNFVLAESNVDGEDRSAVLRYQYMDVKMRLGWREYLEVHDCAGRLTQNESECQLDFTTYTYTHTERDPEKRNKMSGNSNVVWRKGEEHVKGTWLANRLLPKMQEGLLPEHVTLPEVKITE